MAERGVVDLALLFRRLSGACSWATIFLLLVGAVLGGVLLTASPLAAAQVIEDTIYFNKGPSSLQYHRLIVSTSYGNDNTSGGSIDYRYITRHRYYFLEMGAAIGKPLESRQLDPDLYSGLNGGLLLRGLAEEADWRAAVDVTGGLLYGLYQKGHNKLFFGVGILEEADMWIIDNFTSVGLVAQLSIGNRFLFFHQSALHRVILGYYFPFFGISADTDNDRYHNGVRDLTEDNSGLINVLLDIFLNELEFTSWHNTAKFLIKLEYQWKFAAHLKLLSRYEMHVEYVAAAAALARYQSVFKVFWGIVYDW